MGSSLYASTFRTLAGKLADRRQQLGLSLEEVASKAAVGVRFVWDLEHGQPRPEYIFVHRVVTALGFEAKTLPNVSNGAWTSELARWDSSEIPDKFFRVGVFEGENPPADGLTDLARVSRNATVKLMEPPHA